MPKELDLLTIGNSKIGNIFNWSIPAITNCPGKSPYCEKVCYACNGFYNMPSVVESLARKLEISKTYGFKTRMIEEIDRRKVKTLRIHVAGDWYSVPYIRAWHRIIRACPDTTFYTYTRSWNVPQLWRSILVMAAEDNLVLWLSDDHSMRRPPKSTRARIAYLSQNDEDVPGYKVDLIFRANDDTVAKSLGPYGTLVCPVEQGVERQVKITCETCGVCFERSQNEKTETSTYEALRGSRNLERAPLLPQLC